MKKHETNFSDRSATPAGLASLVAGLAAAAVACGASGTGTGTDPGVVPQQVSVNVDAGTRFQLMQGFGAAVGFEINFLSQHPNREEIYQTVFADLGLQVLRVGNWYQNASGDPTNLGDFMNTVDVVTAARASLGHDPIILMSSWSPPAAMKSNQNIVGGTLRTLPAGGFDYPSFGQWWRSALDAHAALGVNPTYISIQNEPDFVPTGTNTWASNLFDATEGTNAGYAPALDAVTTAIADMSAPPKLLGPEVSGIAGNRVQNYLTGMSSNGDLDRLDGIAHHLYNGGNGALPNSFNAGIGAIAAGAGDKPLFMTEYGATPVDAFNVAWLIHNAVTVENAACYLHWDLIWGDSIASTTPQGLVSTEFPGNQANWQTPKGYRINDAYYSVKHFSKWIDVGWQRVAATASSAVIKASAYTSPDGQQLTLVLLNTDSADHSITVDGGGFPFTTSAVYRTSGTDERTASIGALPANGAVDMPARSLVTVTLAP